jgi:hypothetical protein
LCVEPVTVVVTANERAYEARMTVLLFNV